VSKLSHIPCIEKCSNKTDVHCEACVLAKFHRYPFPLSKSAASHMFEVVHIDLWGPYEVSDKNGAHYFLTIRDDSFLMCNSF